MTIAPGTDYTTYVVTSVDRLHNESIVTSSNTFQLNTVVPVELISFSTEATSGKILLTWQTATETNNYGFEIERKFLDDHNWTTIGFKKGKGTTTELNEYYYSDIINTIDSRIIKYRLKQIDYNGRYTYSNEIEVMPVPLKYSLEQNYPNPFNPTTTIKFNIAQNGFVSLKVFDILSNETATILNEEKPAGMYEINYDASALSSGVYFYQLKVNGFISLRKMIVIK